MKIETGDNRLSIRELYLKYCDKDNKTLLRKPSAITPNLEALKQRNILHEKIKLGREILEYIELNIIPFLEHAYHNRFRPIGKKAFTAYRNLFGFEPCRAHRSILKPLSINFLDKYLHKNQLIEYLDLINLLLKDTERPYIQDISNKLVEFKMRDAQLSPLSSNASPRKYDHYPVKQTIKEVIKVL